MPGQKKREQHHDVEELHPGGEQVVKGNKTAPSRGGQKGRKGEFGSPYSISDYYAVNPDYGTLEDFKKLVAAAPPTDPTTSP